MQDRIRIAKTGENLRISIGPSRKMSTLIFFSILALSWLISTLAAISEYYQTGNALGQPLTWQRLIWWLVFGLALFYPVLTLAYGVENLTVQDGTLTVKKQILGLSTETRRLEAAKISDVRVYAYKGSTLSLEYSWLKWGVGGGMVAISYPHKKTYQFGRLISEKEAQKIVKLIKEYVNRGQR